MPVQHVRLRGRNRGKIRIGSGAFTSGTGNSFGGNQPYIDWNTQATVDINDKVAGRVLNTKNGEFFSVPNTDHELSQMGTAAVVTTNSGLVVRAPKDLVVHGVYAVTGVAPANTPILIDVKQVATPTAAGTSIFAGTANRVSIGTATDNASSVGTANIPLANALWKKGTFLRVEIPQVGSAPTGSYVTVTIQADLPLYDSLQNWETGEGATVANPWFTA